MKLYATLVRLLRVFTRFYFLDVHATGRRNLRDRGPVMLAANHPGSVLDAILIATRVSRPVHYLARSGLFRWPGLAALLHRVGAIPVYRPGEGADHARRNEQAFARVFELFERGGCVGIFPEGRNSPRTRVGELRSGAARIALGAEARNAYRLGLEIVPVGITYDSRELLMSAVLLRFGRPIRVADYAERHAADPEAAVRALTADLQYRLRRQALHVEDDRLARMADDLAAVFRPGAAPGERHADANETATEPGSALKRWLWNALTWRRRGSPQSARALDRRVLDRQHVGDVLARADSEAPRAVATLRRQLDRYMDHLGQARLNRSLAESLDEPIRQRWPLLRMTVYAVAMAPIALFGAAHNGPPYVATWLGSRAFRDDAVRAFAAFGVGLLAFGATYAGIGVWLWQSTTLAPAWIAGYLALLPPTGLTALTYRRNVLVHRDRILLRTLLWNRRELARLLRHERDVIAARFETLARNHGR